MEQLQKRNAELEDEVGGLKKRLATASEVDAQGNQKLATHSGRRIHSLVTTTLTK